ncbi:MAG: phosphatase PAP2 family protein [Elusimicrobiales bacterium]
MLLKTALLCLALVPAAKAGGDETVLFSPAYGKRVVKDIIEVPVKPFHWDKKDLTIAGSVLGATGIAFIFDSQIRDYYYNPAHRNNFWDSVSDVTTHFGDYKMQLPLIMGSWAAGLATGNSTLTKIAADGAEASIIAAGLITPMLVYITGRALPCDGEDAYKFRPFTPMRYSFPSGHTTEAFTMAAVIDQNLRKHFGYWHTPFVYAMAVGTAHSRVYDETHYLSDVVLASGIGWGVGYWIANKPRNPENSVMLLPSPSGLMVAVKF